MNQASYLVNVCLLWVFTLASLVLLQKQDLNPYLSLFNNNYIFVFLNFISVQNSSISLEHIQLKSVLLVIYVFISLPQCLKNFFPLFFKISLRITTSKLTGNFSFLIVDTARELRGEKPKHNICDNAFTHFHQQMPFLVIFNLLIVQTIIFSCLQKSSFENNIFV